MTREHNWADNHTFVAGHIHRPSSIDEARRLVAEAPRIHPIGARHSFNGVADSPGDLISLGDIAPAFVIDAERRTVTAGAGVNYSGLASYLHRAGWALHNMASLPHVSVAGAISTGTHGSGDRLSNLATAVAALELITATGEALLLSLGGRPHWGKIMHAAAARLEPLYPKMADFRQLARAYDPEGKFRNEFLERHVFG